MWRTSLVHAQSAASGYVRSEIFATMVLADADLGAGDLGAACATALDALDLGEQLKSAAP